MKRATKHEKKMRWLGENRPWLEAEYPGMWVAIDDQGLVGVGGSPDEAISRAEEKGIKDVLVTGVKRRKYQGIYLVR